jgi:ADP-dependent NAD(P)H-hydrate dehydratase / NAD(P)H-hydrate epimerase
MIKILNTKQIKEADAFTITKEPVSSIDLMERASRAFVEWFVQRFDQSKKIGIVCGTGNNGGDGLAIARLLSGWGYSVKVWIVRGLVTESSDFKTNFERIRGKLETSEIVSDADQNLFTDRHILIDAIFGSGLSRTPEGIYAQAIRCMNRTSATRIAVDVPSGLFADSPSSGEIVKANHTVTFEFPKLSFFFPQSHEFTGEWHVVEIGLHHSFVKNVVTNYFFLTLKDVRKMIKPRSRFAHKGNFGHALLVSGSLGKIGAAVLAAKAVLRSGVGLLTVHLPRCGYQVIQTSVPEAMASLDPDENIITQIPDVEKYSTIGIGPGLGQHAATTDAFKKLLTNFKKPLVIDADALNILAANTDLLSLIPEGSILTPHPKEFERIVGPWKDDFERLDKQITLAKTLNSVIVLKGAFTSIADPNGAVYFNSTGNPGMATGGTGDVLTGILTGFLAQNYTPIEAAIIGVFIHGTSGDVCRREKTEISLIASDLVEYLPQAFLKIGCK